MKSLITKFSGLYGEWGRPTDPTAAVDPTPGTPAGGGTSPPNPILAAVFQLSAPVRLACLWFTPARAWQGEFKAGQNNERHARTTAGGGEFNRSRGSDDGGNQRQPVDVSG